MSEFQTISPSQLKENNNLVSRRWIEVRPQSSISPFSGNITFQFQNSGFDWLDFSKSYFYMKYLFLDGSGTAVHKEPLFPAMLTMSTMFSSIMHRVNNTVVDNITNVPECEGYVKRESVGYADRQGSGMVENFDNKASRKDFAKDNIANDMVWLPGCLSLFNQPNLIPPTSSHQITFAVDADFMKKMIESDDNANYYNAAADDSYRINISEFVLYLCMVEGVDTAKGEEISFNCSSVDCHVKPAISDFYGTYTVKPSTYKFAFATQSSQTPGTVERQKLPPTIFRATDGSDTAITTLRVKYAGRTEPDGQYNDSISQPRRHIMDEMLQNGKFYTNNTAESLTENIKTLGQIYTFDFTKLINERSTNAEVYCKNSMTPANANYLLFTEYIKNIILKYNENSEISEVFVSE